MGTSAIITLREIILETLRQTARGEWKILILDSASRRLLDSAVKEDDVLQEHVANIEQIEQRRATNAGLDAVYLLSPEAYIVDCLLADIECQRYRRSFIIWTSPLSLDLQRRIESSGNAGKQVVHTRVLNIDFFARESHLITFRDPYSFLTLFHPACNQLIKQHMELLSRKIVSICVSLGEYPIIRYYRPRDPLHEANVLCSHLAKFVQDGLDHHAKSHSDFPPPSPRPRGILMITDRTMDLFAPLIHEFTYQAMVHDLLPVIDGDRSSFKTVLNQGTATEEEREMVLGEEDKIWLENRHLHMKDLLDKLVADFNKFRADNPQFAESSRNQNTVSNMKDMIAGLANFQQGKDLYSLHLGMAQQCATKFKEGQLADIASVEQSLATGLDEDHKKPKNLADQVVRLLDDDTVAQVDRLRLILQYIMYRDGVFQADIEKLLAHAQLALHEGETIENLHLLGVRVLRQLKDQKTHPSPIFARSAAPLAGDDTSLSRFEPAIKSMLEEQLRGTLDQALFPYTKPLLDANEALAGQMSLSQASLRSAKPTWARTRPSALEPRQRIIIFMAGGATYSESRVCYDASRSFSKDVYLATSHMLTPGLFLRQLKDLSKDRRQLDLPADRPKPKAPAHLFERELPPGPRMEPPTAGTSNMALSGGAVSRGLLAGKDQALPSPPVGAPANSNKLHKDSKEKRRGFFKF